MKVAVASRGKDLSSMVDPRFGRARYFLVVETETGEFEVVDNNQNLNAVQGAGIQAGQNVVNTGVEAIITGNVGPNAFKTLMAGSIKIYLCKDLKVEDAIEKFKSGELEEQKDANVQGHW